MTTCLKCSSENSDDSLYCQNCGTRLAHNLTIRNQNNYENKSIINKRQIWILRLLGYFIITYVLDYVAFRIIFYEKFIVLNPYSSLTAEYSNFATEINIGIDILVLIVCIIQLIIYQFLVGSLLSNNFKENGTIILIAPIIHWVSLVLLSFVFINNIQVAESTSFLLTGGIIIGIFHLSIRIRKYDSLAVNQITVNNESMEDFEKRKKEKDKRNKNDTRFLLNYFEFLGGGRHG